MLIQVKQNLISNLFYGEEKNEDWHNTSGKNNNNKNQIQKLAIVSLNLQKSTMAPAKHRSVNLQLKYKMSQTTKIWLNSFA